MKPKEQTKPDVRQRILETADRLFYLEGIRSVGIDRIIAEAGVAKMSLYNHFASKDELIVATLEHRERTVFEFFRTAMLRHARQSSKLLAFFAALKDLFESEGFRGCPFQNAASELADPNHAGAQFVQQHKSRFSQMLAGFVTESVEGARAELAPMIGLLVEGAAVTARIQGSASSADVARDAAVRLLKNSP